MDMEGDRWPKICLTKETRGISNQNPTKSGKEFKVAIAEVGEGGIWKTIKTEIKKNWNRK